MDVTQMRYFCEVAETQRITESAKRLHISQPALSQSLSRLEKEVGYELFEAYGRGIRLTAEGAYLKSCIDKILKSVDDIPGGMERVRQEREKTVSLRVSSATGIVVSMVTLYKQLHPDVNFKLSETKQRGESGIVVTCGAGYGRVETEELSDTRFTLSEKICLAAPRDRLRDENSITLEEIENLDMVTLAENHSFKRIIDQLCKKNDIYPNYTYSCECSHSFMQILNSGLAASFIPQFTWAQVNSQTVAFLPVPVENFGRTIRVDLIEEARPTEESRRFFEFFRDEVNQFYGQKDNLLDPWELSEVQLYTPTSLQSAFSGL